MSHNQSPDYFIFFPNICSFFLKLCGKRGKIEGIAKFRHENNSQMRKLDAGILGRTAGVALHLIFNVCDAFERFPAAVCRLYVMFHFMETRFDFPDLLFCLFVKQGVRKGLIKLLLL